jgi:hypothetical protein
MPSGMPEWPYPGGMLRQPARLVDAVRILQAEMQHIATARGKGEAPQEPEPAPEKPSAKAIREARRRAQ